MMNGLRVRAAGRSEGVEHRVPPRDGAPAHARPVRAGRAAPAPALPGDRRLGALSRAAGPQARRQLCARAGRLRGAARPRDAPARGAGGAQSRRQHVQVSGTID
jgi:hypothetical protein